MLRSELLRSISLHRLEIGILAIARISVHSSAKADATEGEFPVVLMDTSVYRFMDFLPIHKWFTGYRSLDHFPNREVIGFKVIHHFLNQREISETHIAAEGVT